MVVESRTIEREVTVTAPVTAARPVGATPMPAAHMPASVTGKRGS